MSARSQPKRKKHSIHNVTSNCKRLSLRVLRTISLHWRDNERGGISNHQPHDCLLNCLFTRRSISKFCVTGLCAGNSPVTGEFPAQKASNAENVSVWWRHHYEHNKCEKLISVIKEAIATNNEPWLHRLSRRYWLMRNDTAFFNSEQRVSLCLLYDYSMMMGSKFCWNSLRRMVKIGSYIVNLMPDDGLMTTGAEASQGKIMIYTVRIHWGVAQDDLFCSYCCRNRHNVWLFRRQRFLIWVTVSSFDGFQKNKTWWVRQGCNLSPFCLCLGIFDYIASIVSKKTPF